MLNSESLKSIKEVYSLPNDDLARQELSKKFSQGNREEGVQKAFHRIFLIFIYSVSIVGIFTVCTRLCHLFLPCDYTWLTDTQVQSIDKLFFSGAIGGFIANYVKKVNNK